MDARSGWAGAAQRRRLVAAFTLALAVGLVGLGGAPAGAAGPACQTLSPTGAYTVKVCLTVGSGLTLTGPSAVSSTVTITGTSPGIRKLEYTLDGAYLITDLESPYAFSLPSAEFLDGTHTVQANAHLRDGNVVSSPPVDVIFANGTLTPPPAPSGFQPTPGRPVEGEAPFVVVATGDGAGGRVAGDSVVNLIESWNPNLFLYTGDVYEKGTDTEFFNWYGHEGLRWGKFKSITNPIIGNHEYENGVAPGYFKYWSGVPDYYSYDAGGWHFIALNSTVQFNQYLPGSPQYEWLQQDLAAHPDGCTMAYFHHPILSVGPQSDTPKMVPMWELMSDNGVDLVVTGHDHNYQRFVPIGRDLQPAADGITTFVAGGGGHGIQSAVRMDSRIASIADTTTDGFGALRFELSGASAHFTYVNPNGTVRDEGTVQCGGVGDDEAPPSVPGNVTANAPEGPDVTVAWSASIDDHGVASYEIRRGEEVVGSVPGTQTSFTDTTTEPLTEYTYQVRAVDLSGNPSDWSAPVVLTTPDEQVSFVWTVTADAYVDGAKPTTPLGTKPELRLDTSPEQITYLRFAATGLGMRTPSSVVLEVRSTGNLTAGFDVRRISGNWSEGSVTHATAPTLGEKLATSGPVTGGTWVSIPIEGLVSGDGTYEVALVPLSTTGLKLDSREAGNPARLVAEVTPGPVAFPVSVSTEEDMSAAWAPQVSADPGAELTCSIASGPAKGQASVTPDCTGGVYMPNPDANGTDSFTYTVTDGTYSSTSTVSVTVAAVNDAPTAAPAAASTWAGSAVTVLLKATDAEGECPLAFAFEQPAHGTVDQTGLPQCTGGSGSVQVTYTPEPGWTGADSFTFTVTDPSGAQGGSMASITVDEPPGTFSVAPSADAFTDASRPTSNYGTRADLRLDNTPQQEVYVRFPVTGLGSSTAAGLVLRIRAASNLTAGFEVRTGTGGWTEAGLTAQNAPGAGTLLATSGPVSTGNWVEIALPPEIRPGDGDVDLVLTPLSGTALRLDSRETASVPELVVNR